jgi:tetratricopeptide (TPR) repeat protein
MLFDRSENMGYIQPSAIPPYAFFSIKFHPVLAEAVVRGQELGVFYQLRAPLPSAREEFEGVDVRYRLLDSQDQSVAEISGRLGERQFSNLGTASIFWTFKTADLSIGEYKLEITASLGEQTAIAYSEPIRIAAEGARYEPITAYGRILNMTTPDPALEKANQLINLGEPAIAVGLLASAKEQWPGNDELASVYADALDASGDLEEAIRVLEEVSLRKPSEAVWKRRIGMLQLRTGKFNKAVAFLEQVRLIEGDSTEVLNPLGEAYRFLGNNEKARETWERSLSIDSNQPRISERLQQLGAKPS